MKRLYTILFATVLSINVNADTSTTSTAFTAPLVLDSEATDFESEAEYNDTQGMVYQNGMRSGRSFYITDYLGFGTQWIYRNEQGVIGHQPGSSVYRNY